MKMWNYIVISVFLALLFEMAGIPVATGLLNDIGINVDSGVAAFKSGSFWTALIALLAVGVGAAIAMGILTKSATENYVILPFILTEVVIFLIPIIGIMSQAQAIGGWIFYLSLLILAPLIVGFGVAMYEHFRGTD